MAAKYSRRKYKRDKTESNSLARKILNIVLLLLTILAGMALLLTLIAPYIKPMEVGLLPMLALIAPAVYLANVVLMLYWLSIWRWKETLLLLLLLLSGLSRVPLFMKVQLTKEYQNESYRGTTKIMSYNVRHLMGDGGEDTSKGIAEFIEEEMPDILSLQEFDELNYEALQEHSSKITKYNHVINSGGVAIISRHPIIDSGDTLGKGGRSIWADIVVGRDTIRLINNHLKSTTITRKDDRYLTSTMVVRDTNRTRTIKSIFRRYHESCKIRSEQVDIIAKSIAKSPYPVVVCGDFNDTPASYAYNTLATELNDSFGLCGKGYAYTYRGFLNMLRIDYILTSSEITPVSYHADREATYSDHLPIYTHVKIN